MPTPLIEAPTANSNTYSNSRFATKAGTSAPPQKDPDLFYFEPGKRLILDVGLPDTIQSVVDEGGRLNVLLAGLPSGTGLSVDGQTGLISGVPTPADVNASPLQLQMTILAQTLTAVLTGERSFRLVSSTQRQQEPNPSRINVVESRAFGTAGRLVLLYYFCCLPLPFSLEQKKAPRLKKN